uniref:Uncharacterized protein n=1 Tax=Rhizophora mucronata TaxID=61149 RepID=A0A2P2J2W0_RHIMU
MKFCWTLSLALDH